MASATGTFVPASFALPNGLTVFGLNQNDTLNVYRDIFEDDCYRMHGITMNDGDTIIDIGANTGLFILFLNKIGVRANVYAFEPSPATFEVLSHNVKSYNKLPVQIFNVGIGERAGELPFTYYPRFSNASTFFPDESPENVERGRQYVIDQIPTLSWPMRPICAMMPMWAKQFIAERFRRYYLKKETVTCQLWNLSDFIRDHGIAKIDFLKIDAEQSEDGIMAGITDEDWLKIRQIVVEVHGGEAATRNMVEMLTQRGYRAIADCNPAMPTLALVYAVRT